VAEQLGAELRPAEVQRARAEAPEFAEVIGRARARARGVAYDPEQHHPDLGHRSPEQRASAEHDEKLRELLKRVKARATGAPRQNPYLRPAPEQLDYLEAAAGGAR
jgi:hypothetical protein